MLFATPPPPPFAHFHAIIIFRFSSPADIFSADDASFSPFYADAFATLPPFSPMMRCH